MAEKVHFASLMDLCHLENSELEPQYQKYKGRVGKFQSQQSRYLDTSTKTRLANIMVQHGSPSRSFGAKSVRSSSQDFCGKGNSRKFFQNTNGEKFQIRNACSLIEKNGFSCLCMCIKIGWEETKP